MLRAWCLLSPGSQLETRALGLLKKLQQNAHQAPLSFQGKPKARRSSAGRARGEPQFSLNDGPTPRKRLVRAPSSRPAGLLSLTAEVVTVISLQTAQLPWKPFRRAIPESMQLPLLG